MCHPAGEPLFVMGRLGFMSLMVIPAYNRGVTEIKIKVTTVNGNSMVFERITC